MTRNQPLIGSSKLLVDRTMMLRRLSRVADSSHYEALLLLRRRRRRQWQRKERRGAEAAAEGHVPVYVGEEMERFEVPTRLLNRPAFVELLRLSAQEYGYEQRGVLRIPCPAPFFRRLLADEEGKPPPPQEAEEELLRSSFDEWFLSSSDAC